MEIRLLESAKEDLREGWEFYEKQSPAALYVCRTSGIPDSATTFSAAIAARPDWQE